MFPRLMTTLMLASTAGVAFAHPGHDHSHWSASVIHGALLLAGMGLVGAGAWLISRRNQSQPQENKD